MPRLSVIMPAHNAGGTIEVAARSTLRAMSRDSELLVYDDASTDETVAIVEGIAEDDRRVRLVHGTVKVGSGAARQALLNDSDSELVANMDADDVSFPWRFFAQKNNLARYDFIFGSYIRFGNSIRKISVASPLAWRPDELPVALLFTNPLLHSTMLAKREAIVKAGGYRSIRRGQDYDLWMRAAACGLRLAKVSIPLTAYRVHPAQISAGDDYMSQLATDPVLRGSYHQLLERLISEASDASAHLLGPKEQAASFLLSGLSGRKQVYLRRREPVSLARLLRVANIEVVERERTDPK